MVDRMETTDVITTGSHEPDELDELDDLVEEDLLVEEISIDGMCGVY
jgi:mycofactocin precursor